MGRNIVLLSDGTGNSAAKVWRTNVWRTFEALDLSGNDQVAFYDDGIGTSTFKPWAILGAFGGFVQTEYHRHLQICPPQLQGRKRQPLASASARARIASSSSA